jgi:hypothetical protein
MEKLGPIYIIVNLLSMAKKIIHSPLLIYLFIHRVGIVFNSEQHGMWGAVLRAKLTSEESGGRGSSGA